MKKTINLTWIAVFFLAVLMGVGGTRVYAKEVAPKKLTLNYRRITLYVGEKRQLKVTAVKPKNASTELKWKSENRKVASVSKEGMLRAKKAGTARIVARSASNPDLEQRVKVTVKKRPKRVEKVLVCKSAMYGTGIRLPWTKWMWDKGYDLEENYAAIRTKKEFREILSYLNEDLSDFLKANFMDTDFEENSLLLTRASYSQYISKITLQGLEIRIDEKGKAYAEVTVELKERADDPGTVIAMDNCAAIAVEISKKDEAMLDYCTIKYNRVE